MKNLNSFVEPGSNLRLFSTFSVVNDLFASTEKQILKLLIKRVNRFKAVSCSFYTMNASFVIC